MPRRLVLEVPDSLNADDVEAEVIVLTGETTVDTAVEAMELGANDYLCKPFPLPELNERSRSISRPRLDVACRPFADQTIPRSVTCTDSAACKTSCSN